MSDEPVWCLFCRHIEGERGPVELRQKPSFEDVVALSYSFASRFAATASSSNHRYFTVATASRSLLILMPSLMCFSYGSILFAPILLQRRLKYIIAAHDAHSRCDGQIEPCRWTTRSKGLSQANGAQKGLPIHTLVLWKGIATCRPNKFVLCESSRRIIHFDFAVPEKRDRVIVLLRLTRLKTTNCKHSNVMRVEQ
jgi:hypothetical protein